MLDSNKLHETYHKYKKNKVEKYTYEDFDFYMWPYATQTKVKHMVLEEYLYVWATKLGSANNIIYYDGFSGCGAYYNAKDQELNFGSPIIAKQQFIKAKRGSNSYFYLNDKSKENIENLKKIFIKSNTPTNNIIYTIGEFEENIGIFLDQLEKNPKPTFFMIDPFGINAHFSTIERIMKIPKTEVLFNFMYNFTRRFTGYKNAEEVITNLFGTNEWLKFKDLNGDKKEIALKDLYRQQLKKCAKYVYQYRMSFPNDKRTYYYLFHASNNRDGCSIMKDAFAKVNLGNVEFLGPNQPNPDQLALWDQTQDKIEQLKLLIWNEYQGKSVLYGEIVDEYIDSTPYLERHIREATKSMDKEFLDIQHVETKTTVKPNDIIKFYNTPVQKVISTQMSLF